MAEAAVAFLLENLNHLLIHHASLLLDAKSLVENLVKDLLLFEAFLKECDDETLRQLIRDAVHEAEDVIDAFFTMAVVSKSKNYFKRAFDSPERLLIVAKEVETIGAKVRSIYNKKSSEFVALKIHRGEEASADKIPQLKKDILVRRVFSVAFEYMTEYVINFLTAKSMKMEVFTMMGIPGLGVTTLARKIFSDPRIKSRFPTRIWVRVSQKFRKRDVCLSILSNFTNITDDIYCKNDHDLVQLLREKLERRKFLIVMDDVRTAVAWTEFRDAFPETNNRGRLLITGPDALAWNVRCGGFLTYVDMLVLLQLVAAGKHKRHSGERPSTYLNQDPDELATRIISSSYHKLPFYLRPCFLYLGMFPEGFEIPVQKLILMWIAEGFIQSKPRLSLEEVAMDYLEVLITRNLVMVDKVSSEGKVKACHIYERLREFCKKEAGNINENFFQEMKMTSGGIFEPSLPELEKFRRICMYSNVGSFFKAKPFGPRVRSFLSFSKKEIPCLSGDISSIPSSFKLLRVLEGECIRFTKFPTDLTHLVHLRYLVLSSDFDVLPKIITKLRNLQTLIVGTTSRTLDVNANIWKMIELRHLKINASATLLKKGKTGGQELQTLGAISPQSCTEEFFDRACGLKKLGIRGRIVTLIDTGGLERLVNVDKLKLVNDVFPLLPCESPLPYLPKPYNFPPKLRRLTLSTTNLDWTHMSTLAMLDTLVVLKLKNRAFVGRRWETVDGGFRRLELLHIERTDLVDWLALGFHFPRLKCLVLRNCEKLDAIPIGLADSGLQKLELDRVSKSASHSAREIDKVKKLNQGTKTCQRSGFKLYIDHGEE